MVARHRPLMAAEKIVDRETECRNDRTAVGELRLDTEKSQRRRDDAAKVRMNRQYRLQWPYKVRRVFQQKVAFQCGFGDEAKFTGFKILQAAVNEPRWRRTRT